MAQYLITDTYLQNIANAIRAKNGSSNQYTPAEMGNAISAIPTSSSSTTVTLQNKTVTPTKSSQTVTADSGYDGLGNVTVSAIPSQYIEPTGSQTITENNTYDVTNLASVIVNVPTSGGTDTSLNTQVSLTHGSVKTTTYTATGVKLTIAKTGTYTVTWIGWRNNSGNTAGTQLYINGTAYGSATTTFTGTYGQRITLTGVSLTAGDEIEIYARARSTSYYMYAGNLIAQQTA